MHIQNSVTVSAGILHTVYEKERDTIGIKIHCLIGRGISSLTS